MIKRTEGNLALCTVLFVVSLVVSNVVAGKLIDTGVTLFGAPVLVPCAVLWYAVTFLMTDAIGEIWGKAEADRAVFLGIVGQLAASGMIYAAEIVPAADAEAQRAFGTLLGHNWIFAAASLTSYIASQYWDVMVFHAVRDRMLSGGAPHSARWVWNNLSTMTSQIIDTVLFIGIAFGIGMGWLFDPAMHGTLAAMIVGQYAVKFVIAMLDTPFFMLFTRGSLVGPSRRSRASHA